MRLAFLSTHLTGTGHLVRTAALARAGAAQGHDVLVINGGRPLAHLDLSDLRIVQLPPLMVSADLDYGSLRKPDGEIAEEAYLEHRSNQVVEALKEFAPDILITETYPLGRRNLAVEYGAALNATGAVRVASVRDIPEPKPKRLTEVEAELEKNFAALLVHGDRDFIPLSASWPFEHIGAKIHHTGYVADRPDGAPVKGGVLVSVGGGIHGRRLLPIAAEAARTSPRPWRILVGGADAADLHLPVADNLTVEPVRPDYRSLLAGAEISVSLCGYNTAVDLALCDTPAILVPMAEKGEQEQVIRARHLARHDGIEVMQIDGLTPAALGDAVERMAGERRPKLPLGTNGAARAIEILESL
ncbi:MAG: glycosyltransferase [Pseudomonadota bacterium]